ncbi:MAG TPA: hypothetical protein VK138_13190 [Acidiferrobacterales bacterium]|nr:hypothetical protein [Acidiferrobacterales bacterium]
MTVTVFYSWQSDRPPRVNRDFIEAALVDAVNQIDQHSDLQKALHGETLVIDRDTKNVPGTPPVTDTILTKISECGIFIPDFTFVGTTTEGRQLQNPNVLIEYGWALKEVTHRRIIPVMNAAFGAPSKTNLPFDMRHMRYPVTYELSENANAEDYYAKAKKSLGELLFNEIKIIIESGALDGLVRPLAPIVETSAPQVSTFLTNGEPLGTFVDKITNKELVIHVPQVETLFLRIYPTNQIERLKSPTTALRLIENTALAPMGGFGYSEIGIRNRNRHGAFTCSCRQDQATSLTELCLHGELFGIDTRTINKKGLMENAGVTFGFFPCSALEQVFITTLMNYLAFAESTLKWQPPLRFIAGATGVAGYRMSGSFSGLSTFDGNVIEDPIIYSGYINDYGEKPETILRPFFNHVWDACGLVRPDVDRL